ncbi:DUF2085 domain-containing protein [bacterium]|nr:DUF2085 domain-containing protein [bacterium]
MFPYYKYSDNRLSYIYIALLAAVLGWLFLILSVPWLAEGDAGCRKGAAAVTLFFSPVCHQIPGRCFIVNGHALPVCARCSGLYSGFLTGIVLFPFFRRRFLFRTPPRYILVCAALPAAAEFLLAKTGIWEGCLFIRFLTGLLPGTAALFYVLPQINKMVTRNEVRHD